MYHYGLIGNCQSSALISAEGSVDWLCFPRPDSPPLFGHLLDANGGRFAVQPSEQILRRSQSYLPNTNVLQTDIELADSTAFRITDFFPRYHLQDRIHRPMVLYRIVEPLRGQPSVTLFFEPVNGWSKERVVPQSANGALVFPCEQGVLRLNSNLEDQVILEKQRHTLTEPVFFALNWNAEEIHIEDSARQSLKKTIEYWNRWVKHCSIPTLYQSATIRSALALKLHCYEDTGAILAALTTSLPEEKGKERNWDYRFCWLRDAYFCLSAFRNLGHFEEMENFINFLLPIADSPGFERLAPVYRLDGTSPLPEILYPNWAGYAASQPVRSGNQAAEHIQNDVYGEMLLTLTPIFVDERFRELRTPEQQRLFERLTVLCASNISQPDAGLWEIRNGWREHSFSNLMCWAGIDRAIQIQEQGYLQGLALDLPAERSRAQLAINRAVVEGVLTNGPSDPSLDASLLLLPVLSYPDPALCRQTVGQIERGLQYLHHNEPTDFLYRYLRKDDFGEPKAPFVICSFWLVQALAAVGQMQKARKAMEKIMSCSNELGLLAEHYHPETRTQCGNFPQAYSHVGLINAAFAVSPPWNH